MAVRDEIILARLALAALAVEHIPTPGFLEGVVGRSLLEILLHTRLVPLVLAQPPSTLLVALVAIHGLMVQLSHLVVSAQRVAPDQALKQVLRVAHQLREQEQQRVLAALAVTDKQATVQVEAAGAAAALAVTAALALMALLVTAVTAGRAAMAAVLVQPLTVVLAAMARRGRFRKAAAAVAVAEELPAQVVWAVTMAAVEAVAAPAVVVALLAAQAAQVLCALHIHQRELDLICQC